MKHKYLFIAMLSLLTGCITPFWTDALTGGSDIHPGGSTFRRIVLNSIDDGIKSELQLRNATNGLHWDEYWTEQCESFYNDRTDPDESTYIDYIIEKRRAAGLPEIDTILGRKFRSSLVIFEQDVDSKIAMELAGNAPPVRSISYSGVFTYRVRTWPENWSEYWQATEKDALGDPDISTNGMQYLEDKLKSAMLPAETPRP